MMIVRLVIEGHIGTADFVAYNSPLVLLARFHYIIHCKDKLGGLNSRYYLDKNTEMKST